MKINQSLAPNTGASLQKGTFSAIIGTPNYQKMLETAIADPKKRANFVSSLISAVSTNQNLRLCDPDSIISAALPFVSFDFSFGTGCAYIIPYGSKAQFQMGAKGYRQLAMRSGQYKDLDTIEVRDGEYKGRDPRTGKPKFDFITDDEDRESRPIIGYRAYFELLNGFEGSVYWPKSRVIKHAQRYSKSFDADLLRKYEAYEQTGEGLTADELRACSTPWISSFSDMAEKTVLKQLLSKKGILSIELQNAFSADNDGGITEQDTPMFNAQPAPVEKPEKPVAVEPETGEVVDAPVQHKRGRKPKAEVIADEAPLIQEPPVQEPGPAAEDVASLFFDPEVDE